MCAEDARVASHTEIRPCQQQDLPAICEILAQSPEAANWSGASLQSALDQNARYFLVADKRHELSGFIVGRVVTDEGEILNLAVKMAHQRGGVGRALVQSLLRMFASECVATVFLEVRESNHRAIAFYESLGFAAAGTRPGYYANPAEAAQVLRARLAPS